MTIRQEKTFHYLIVGVMSGLIIVGAGFAYLGLSGKMRHYGGPGAPEIEQIEGAGQAKPLPDFLVDKVPSDELEQLKP